MADEPLQKNTSQPATANSYGQNVSKMSETKPITPIPSKELPEPEITLENFHTMAKDVAEFKKSHGAVLDDTPKPVAPITPALETNVEPEIIPTELIPDLAAETKPKNSLESEEVSALAHAIEAAPHATVLDKPEEITLETVAPTAPPLTAAEVREETLPEIKIPEPRRDLFPRTPTPPVPPLTPAPDLSQTKPEVNAYREPIPENEKQSLYNTPAIAPTENPVELKQFVGMPKSAEEAAPEPPQEPISPPPPPPDPNFISPLRTLRGDVTSAVAQHNITLAGISIKEDSRRRIEAEQVVKKSYAGKLLGLLALLLFLGGGGALGYVLYVKKTPEEKIIKRAEDTSLIFAESSTQIDTTKLSPEALREKIKNHLTTTNLRVGTIEDIVFTRRVENEKETHYVLLTAIEFLDALGADKDDHLGRFINPEFMYGVYSFKDFSAFLMLRTNFYQSVFAEMLAWEPRLARDLGFLVTDKPFEGETLLRQWEDQVIENIDVRVLKDANGEVVMLWSFLGTRDTLLIAKSVDTFKEVVTREKTPRQVYR